ncbi:MAG: metallophosphoesterase [Candidatus Solibacter sp.]
MKRVLAIALLLMWGVWSQSLPNRSDSFFFAVIGDSGTGLGPQYEVGKALATFQQTVPFKTVVMLGDNIYGSDYPKDFVRKFELPYKTLLDRGVKFHAALGNHDSPRQTAYKPFNMEGRRYYTFKPKSGIRFFALDSTLMDKAQLEWLDKELADSGSEWKIVFFHHPLYSSGARHGSDMSMRSAVEPLLVKYGVALALAGHDHFYERIKPQQGVHYFVVGGSAKLRAGNVRRGSLTDKAFDTDRSFLLMEIDGDTLYYQAVSRKGVTVDSGSFERPRKGHLAMETGEAGGKH